jgi:hypothetical protein
MMILGTGAGGRRRSGRGARSVGRPAAVPSARRERPHPCRDDRASFHYLHAGERRGCVGGHADSHASPPDSPSLLMRAPASDAAPGPDYPGAQLVRTVKPVLDRHCIAATAWARSRAQRVNLIGVQQGCFSKATRTGPLHEPDRPQAETHGSRRTSAADGLLRARLPVALDAPQNHRR